MFLSVIKCIHGGFIDAEADIGRVLVLIDHAILSDALHLRVTASVSADAGGLSAQYATRGCCGSVHLIEEVGGFGLAAGRGLILLICPIRHRTTCRRLPTLPLHCCTGGRTRYEGSCALGAATGYLGVLGGGVGGFGRIS